MSKKNPSGVVYSTDPDFVYRYENEKADSAFKQILRVRLDSKNRGGKSVTLIEGYIGNPQHLEKLEKHLKSKCGVGGSSKDGVIILQGDVRKKIPELLIPFGYKAKIL